MVIVCEDLITRHLKNGTEKKGYYMDGKLQSNLDYEFKRLQKNWDCIMVIDGEEGSAKTTIASSIAYYLSSLMKTKFDIDDVIFTIPQFEKWLETQPPGSVCLWDEFVLAGLSSDALTRIQNLLIKKMTMIRKKRHLIILVIPYLFMLRKYFAIARTRCLIHVYSPDNLTRGSFTYYSKPNKRMLYMKGIKYWEYNVWRPDFIGSFTDTYGLFYDIDKYETKKDEATDTIKDMGSDGRTEKSTKRIHLIINNLRKKGKSFQEIATLFGCDTSYLHQLAKKYGGYESVSEENKISPLEKRRFLPQIKGGLTIE